MDNEIKKKLRGLAGVVSKLVEPLNENQKFKEKFSDIEVKVLLNATDGKYAALLVIDKGTIHVEGYKNNPKKNLKKKVIGWDGLLQTTTLIFLKILKRDKISKKNFIGKVLTRKIKIRGIKNVLVLLQLFRI
ncbi:hypothetical protein LCGC14_1186830 [marine sediment metagenome]|uniref:SCP2 domain-containing protein n=1 Tax=marine sediment metagenome TaxID=412755 RepID=A0A0F9LKJ4_9ZZZZ